MLFYRCASWVLKCEARYLPTIDFDVLHKTYKLCSLHFENHMFESRKKLKSTAIPTLFLMKPVSMDALESANNSLVESECIQSNQSIQMDNDISISSMNAPLSCSTPGNNLFILFLYIYILSEILGMFW